MASRCNSTLNLNRRLPFRLWALVMAVIFSISGDATQIQLSGVVGGNVTIHCPAEKKQIQFFYLQRGDTFVNGFYASVELYKHSKPWENTRVDGANTTVYMSNLNVSHIGDYRCLIKYTDRNHPLETAVHLSVTAKYSKPVVTVDCKGENQPSSCFLTCSSHGGYPQAKMSWNRTSMFRVVNNSELRSSTTLTYNNSISAFFNCSGGEIKDLSCSVGNVTSDSYTICTAKTHFDTPVVAAVICALVVSIGVVGLLLWYKFRKMRTTAAGVQEEEAVRLNMPEREVPE